jgi:hypothetical protein
VLAYLLGPRGERAITSTIGLPILNGTIIEEATLPVEKALLPHYTREQEENPDLYLQLHLQR